MPIQPETRSGGLVTRLPSRAKLVRIDVPVLADGADMWRIARDSKVLDVNSSYAYLLWCRDFADTSAVARMGSRTVGFVTGYVRPSTPDTVVVWQIAVDEQARGHGVAGALLDRLVDQLAVQGVRRMETTITQDNLASRRLFEALAGKLGCDFGRSELFEDQHFPDNHQAEDLYRIGPWVITPVRRGTT
ncbi:diaminobutyrate acetyltransferase [Fodinicola feengrottensis]|uniref:L-2,4-diaminobutyric acid acetyltransferase n=1 Tax=Fodinicola feengrottensis TaxID=435914 RepID=A0ABN2HZI8_9ACTN|nr:diaminobutyrate acetyltransferase [Fodinicola feengrottensis]